MLVAKFVDNDYMCNKTKFSNFGMSIEKVILVLPINEDVDINYMKLDAKSILMEISEENIVECKRNSSFHVNKAIPIRNLNDDELSIIRSAACQNPDYAYEYAKYVDKKPTPETRSAACKNPKYAYYYALYVDKNPTDETRIVSCQNPCYSYLYAKHVDRKPTNETRIVVCNNSEYAYWYARDVDQKPTDETRNAVCNSPEFAYYYARDVDKKPTNETRIAASKHKYYKKQYERWERSIC